MMNAIRAWLEVAADRAILKRALGTSLVVGIVLTLINHGDEILGGQLDPGHIWPITLTFVIPFVVATTSSVAAIRRSGVPAAMPSRARAR
jgi:Mg/Co/Ni transporter MgtE